METQEQRVEVLIKSLEDVMVVLREIPPGDHVDQHRFIQSMMEKESRKAEFWRSVANKVITGGIWSLIMAVTSAIVFTLKEFFTN